MNWRWRRAARGGPRKVCETHRDASAPGRRLRLRDDRRRRSSGRRVSETDDAELRGEMTITTTLTDAGVGTDVTMLHEGLPPGVPPEDNETGTAMALAKLAALLEPR
jgi:activator of Hsp90 ATPase-like protein